MLGFKMNVDNKSLDALINKYGEEKVNNVKRIVDKYTQKVARDAKEIIVRESHVDTGRLVNSIKPSLKVYRDLIVGEVSSATKYARYIHEGAEHINDTTIVAHYVPFKVAPSLLKWAIRNKVIVEDGKILARKRYKFARSGNPVDIKKGGMKVKIEPTEFFTKPFNKYVDKFLEELKNVMT